MAGILDSSRFIYFVTELNTCPRYKSFVLGGHGDTMVAMLRTTEVNGKKIIDLKKKEKLKEKLDEIIERTKKVVRKLLNI